MRCPRFTIVVYVCGISLAATYMYVSNLNRKVDLVIEILSAAKNKKFEARSIKIHPKIVTPARKAYTDVPLLNLKAVDTKGDRGKRSNIVVDETIKSSVSDEKVDVILKERDDLRKFSIPFLSHPDLPRVLSEEEYLRMMQLVQLIDEALTDNNVTYMLSFGTLLGAYVTHDALPWDDDLDLSAKVEDYEKILRLFGNGTKYPQLATLDHGGGQPGKVKVYFKDDPKAGKYSWSWPFADISFLLDNATRVSFTTNRDLFLLKQHVYPLHYRPFGGMWLPVPRNPGYFLLKHFSYFKCESHFWDHRREVWKDRKKAICNSLISTYPFVKRRGTPRGGIMETLMLNGTSMYTLSLEEPYHAFGHVV